MPSQKKAYEKRYDDEAKWMNFLIDDELFLIYHKEIWDIFWNSIKWMFHRNNEEEFFNYIDKCDRIIKKWLDSDPIYDIIVYIKTKTIYSDIKTDFYDKEIPEEGLHYICLSIILTYSLKKDDKYYPQVFLEECKYVIKKKKKHRHINEESEICSERSDKE